MGTNGVHMMKYYYQYDDNGDISAIVKSAGEPLDVNQIVSDFALGHGRKKYNNTTKEVVYYKNTHHATELDEMGEPLVIGIEEDTSKPREQTDAKSIRTRKRRNP